MRILFLTPYVPSDRAGGEKFTRLLLEDLSRENQVDLVYYKYSFDKDYVSPNKKYSRVNGLQEFDGSEALE